MKCRKKPIVVEAHQWFKNGDHPDDYKNDIHDVADENGEVKVWLGDKQKELGWEGQVVRYFRRPEAEYSGELEHDKCGRVWHDHGYIDTLEGGHTVCPGSWIITGVRNEMYPCDENIFYETYDEVFDAE